MCKSTSLSLVTVTVGDNNSHVTVIVTLLPPL